MMKKFNGAASMANMLKFASTLRSVDLYLSNNETVTAHMNEYMEKLRSKIRGNPLVETLSIEALSKSEKNGLDELANASSILYRMGMVLLVTYIETFIEDFLFEIFFYSPKLMHDYLGDEKMKGKVYLNDVLMSNTKDDLLSALAARSASTASRGSYEVIIKRIEKLVGKKFNPGDSKVISQLHDIRNSIVHENKNVNITSSHFDLFVDATVHLIFYLSDCELDKNIPGAVDQDTLLYQFAMFNE